MSAGEEFDREKRAWAERMSRDGSVAKITRAWFDETARYRYSYNFTWLGRPIIQYPQDIVALQQVVWETKPDLIVETGVAHGGSLVLSASLLRLLGGEGRVVGIDIDIRTPNREAIERHPMAPWISLIEGSSTSEAVLEQVRAVAASHRKVMVILDSNHTHGHVARELELYSPLVCKGSYLIVMDTVIEDMAPGAFPDRPWGPGNNPKTAVREFLARNSRFVVDEELERTLLISVAPSGYLRCVQD
jgi:cephalosporin hydroxylase